MAKILIVDDSRTSRKVLRGILEEAGYEIIGEAPDGEQGVQMYNELKPDIVTLDITMPVLDGIGALKKIKERDSDAKVVMVTAAGQKSKMVEAVKYGASEFVAKPFDRDQLSAIIKKVAEA
ncbi:MAG: response regulator [Lachnospiraceae bacterium]|nr:response regulator [Lachnospiraceae bacterium]